MNSAISPISAGAGSTPTIWGLSPTQLHDRFWAARGVQVVRQGEPSEIVEHSELFLLTQADDFVIFKLARPVEILSWVKPDVVYVRLHDGRERGYHEQVITNDLNHFLRFKRIYNASETRQVRVVLTPYRRIAQLWQLAPSVSEGWKLLRQEISRSHRGVVSLEGDVFDRSQNEEVAQFVRELTQVWKRPDSTVGRVSRNASAWVDAKANIEPSADLIGPVWVGAGRKIASGRSVVGPVVLWDDPECRPEVENLQWELIEPALNIARKAKPKRRTSLSNATKRLFDILFALFALILTLPVYPFIIIAIWLEDGGPFFFSHKRETLNGREFGCLKFRSMRKDADRIKAELAKVNQADGPQFFMENDPRLTRVGRLLRKLNLDELPQFWNVLCGHMSIVGPRPSPFVENQFCPPWREARLSVRPGITGLWQVRRTRRKGLDFQEWIRFDIEYVENASWSMDLKILWETFRTIIRGVLRS
jgi:lipopolysaccharide/colanic/teichoic acid biosynthesis glycosyltransferase